MTRFDRSRVLGTALGLGVVTLALARGGVPTLCGTLLVAGSGALVLEAWLPRFWRAQWPDVSERAWWMLLLAGTALCGLQLVPLPEGALAWVGAYPDDFLRYTDVTPRRISPQPGETATSWSLFAAYWAIAFVSSRIARSGVEIAFACVTLLVLFESTYGLWAWASDAPTIMGVWAREHYIGDATGSYVSRNHYAGLLGAAWPVALAWVLDSEPGARAPSMSRTAAAALLSLLVGAALWASHSRAGLVAAAAGLVAWLLARRRARRAGAGPPPATLEKQAFWAVPAAAALGAVWVGGAVGLGRFTLLPEQTDRFTMWSALFDLPARAWTVGIGTGSFPDVFKMVQPAGLDPSFTAAHNDWLELVLDFGVVGSAVLAISAIGVWLRALPRTLSPLHAGAFGGVCATTLHAGVDFVLQSPANAVLFALLMGTCLNRELDATVREAQVPGRLAVSR